MSDHYYPPCSSCGGLAFHSQDCGGHGEAYGVASGSYGAVETQRHHLQRSECQHGSLSRACERCDDEREIAALKQENAELKHLCEHGCEICDEFDDRPAPDGSWWACAKCHSVANAERDSLRSRLSRMEKALGAMAAWNPGMGHPLFRYYEIARAALIKSEET